MSTFKHIAKEVIGNLEKDYEYQLKKLRNSKFDDHKSYHNQVMRIQSIKTDINKLNHYMRT